LGVTSNWDGRISRRSFVRGAVAATLVSAGGGLTALGAREAQGKPTQRVEGYGPLVPMGALALPRGFSYKVISQQGDPMDDGNLTPGIFDGMGAFPGPEGSTILIRNHENRRRVGEASVIVAPELRYDGDPTYNAGNTKLVVDENLNVVQDFAILGGTDTNCAGGVVGDSWYTCEEVVNRGATGLKHGYNFVIPAYASGPVKAVPQPQQGRMAHEAVAELDGILYETEDRSISADALNGVIGAAFYRFVPDSPGVFEGSGTLEALKLSEEFRANMNKYPVVGKPYPVEWVTIDYPDHEDDTDDRREREAGFTPTRIQAQDKGAAIFDREEGIWVGGGKVYFDCTSGGAANLGQVFEFDPVNQRITLIYESTDMATLENPDNIVIVPKTGDIFLQEDGEVEDFVRGLTPEGKIYDFAKAITNNTEFCGGSFSPNGTVFFLNQQGARGSLPAGPLNRNAVTYAITGPFSRRR
jgi:uncharacterized protein